MNAEERNEQLWGRFRTEFPSDKTLRTIFGPEWVSKTYLIFLVFFVNMTTYLPIVFGSDVAMADAQNSGVMRKSYNPVRRLLGNPYVTSYTRVLRQNRSLSEGRRGSLRGTIFAGLRDLRRAEARHPEGAKVPLITDGAFNTKFSHKKNRILGQEFLSFVRDNAWEMQTETWRVVVEGQNAYLASRPEYLEAKRKRLDAIVPNTARAFDLPLDELDP